MCNFFDTILQSSYWIMHIASVAMEGVENYHPVHRFFWKLWNDYSMTSCFSSSQELNQYLKSSPVLTGRLLYLPSSLG